MSHISKEASRFLGVDPALAPASDAFHDPPQILAGLGQAILRPAGRVLLSPHDARVFEIAQALRQQSGRHARHALAQLVEALGAAQKLAQDGDRPP
jgi:hypothetical protein